MEDFQNNWKVLKTCKIRSEYIFSFQTDEWKPRKYSLILSKKNPNMFTIFKENIKTLVGNGFKIPLGAEVGSKYRRRKHKKEKKTSWPVLNENIIDPFFDISNITDALKIEKNITEGDIENILARPVVLDNNIAAEDGEDVLPTPDKPFGHQNNEKVLDKSQIKWLNNSVDISDDTIKEVLEAKERDVEDIV